MDHEVLKKFDVFPFQGSVVIIFEGDAKNTAFVLEPLEALGLAEKIVGAARNALRWGRVAELLDGGDATDD